MGDPAVDGAEFISVRVKLGGVTDTLTFGPEELTLPTRARRSAPLPPSAQPLPPNGSDAVVPATKAVAESPRRTAARRRAPAPVSVTVSSSGQAWTMSATCGGRVLVKGSPVTAGVVTSVVDLFAESGLQEAVAEINEVALTGAQERADALRKELAAVESLLRAHQRPAASAGSSERRKSR